MVPAEATDEKYFLGREGELVEIWMGQTTNSWNTIKTQDAVLDILDKVEASGAVATDWAGRGPYACTNTNTNTDTNTNTNTNTNTRRNSFP